MTNASFNASPIPKSGEASSNMKAALIIAAALAVASADVSHLGYQYKVPQTSYGVPSYQIQSSGSAYNPSYSNGVNVKGSYGKYLGSTISQASSYPSSNYNLFGYNGVKNIGDAASSSSNINTGVNFLPVFPVRSGVSSGGLSSGYSSGLNSGYTSGLSSGLSNGYSSGLSSGLSNGYTSGLSSGLVNGYTSGVNGGQYYQTVNAGQSQVQPIYLGSPNQYQYASAEKYQQYVQVQQQPAQVFKHFYVHAAPEEPEPPKPRTPIVLPPPQKHYKIIFVKTPNVASRNSQIVPVQPQNEEKTIVYVLVKKPEEQQEVIVPKVEQKPPSKPEVYFIKYNNKDDQSVINNIVNDYNKDGQSVSFSTGGDNDDASSSSGADVSYSNLPTVTNFSNFPSSAYSDAPSGASISSVSSGPGYATVSNTPSFQTVSSGPSFGSVSSVPSGVSFSTLPTATSFSVPSQSSFSVPSQSTFNIPSQSSFSVPAQTYTYTTGVQNEPVSVSGPAYSTQTFVSPVTVSPSDSGVSASGAEGSTVISSVTPVSIVSTTPAYSQDDFSSISTSQGIPHETYGTPKFRVK